MTVSAAAPPPRARRRAVWAVRTALLLVGLAPLVPPLTAGIPGLERVGESLDVWFAFQCHRDPGRSAHLLERALPVCTRCLGIYSGLGLGGLLAWPRLGPWSLRLWVGVAAGLMILDVALERAGIHASWPLARLLSGLALAYPVGAALVQAVRPE